MNESGNSKLLPEPREQAEIANNTRSCYAPGQRMASLFNHAFQPRVMKNSNAGSRNSGAGIA